MAPFQVHIKHAGKVYDVQLDPDQPPLVFKEAVSQLTGVPVDRMKVMIKGGVLKDDSNWTKIAPKAGQTFMVIGAAGALPKPPEKPIVFLEDMDDAELAQALIKPAGLKNLGNTCYMNATVQAMRAIPELQAALNASPPTSALPRALRDLYATMAMTTEDVMPFTFLQVLRQVVPQFGELVTMGRGRGYAQQDAEECWIQLTNSLQELSGLPGPAPPPGSSSPAGEEGAAGAPAPAPQPPTKKFVQQYMMGEMRRELRCDDAPDEPVTTSVENVLKVECNISITTNYMHNGITDALTQKVEKYSPSLGREAVYTQTSRLSRLPAYLTIHMVRFAWRTDINKKTKIMRRVKFPEEYSACDLVTDELRAKLGPVGTRLKEIEKERAERRKVRKRTRAASAASVAASGGDASLGPTLDDVEMADATQPAVGSATGTGTTTAGELEEESVYRERELKELLALVSPDLRADVGCSDTGLYDLVAIVTHKGAAADSGHYIGFVKKSVFQNAPPTSAQSSSMSTSLPPSAEVEDDEDWYKFDDDKVSVFPKEKLSTLDGGGEDSAAYVLLYKSKALA